MLWHSGWHFRLRLGRAGLGRGPPASSGPLHPTRSRGSRRRARAGLAGLGPGHSAARPFKFDRTCQSRCDGPPGPRLVASHYNGLLAQLAGKRIVRAALGASKLVDWLCSESGLPVGAGHESESIRHTECVNWHKNAPHHHDATQPRLWYSVCQCLSALLRRLEKRVSDGTARSRQPHQCPACQCSALVQSRVGVVRPRRPVPGPASTRR